VLEDTITIDWGFGPKKYMGDAIKRLMMSTTEHNAKSLYEALEGIVRKVEYPGFFSL